MPKKKMRKFFAFSHNCGPGWWWIICKGEGKGDRVEGGRERGERKRKKEREGWYIVEREASSCSTRTSDDYGSVVWCGASSRRHPSQYLNEVTRRQEKVTIIMVLTACKMIRTIQLQRMIRTKDKSLRVWRQRLSSIFYTVGWWAMVPFYTWRKLIENTQSATRSKQDSKDTHIHNGYICHVRFLFQTFGLFFLFIVLIIIVVLVLFLFYWWV